MEACLAEMDLANAHLSRVFGEIQEHVFHEDKAISKEKAIARIRAKMPPPQRKLEDTTTARELKKKRKAGSVQHLGEAKDAERMIAEEEEDARED